MKRALSITQRWRAVLALGLALAGWNLPASAQVGYVNVVLTNGFNFLVNPFDLDGTNHLDKVIHVAPDGTQVFLWSVTNQTFTAPATYSADTTNWDINYTLMPGTGFVMRVTSTLAWTQTFVGNVLQGRLTNVLAGTNKFTLVGSQLPIAAALTNLAFPGLDGDNVYTFSSARQSFSDAFTFFNGYGWFDPDGVVSNAGPTIAVGTSFFVQNPGPATNWLIISSNYISAAVAAQSGTQSFGQESPPTVSQLVVSDGLATLAVHDPGGGPYDVQFSTDGLNWSMVASSQRSAIWRERFRSGRLGFYRAVRTQPERNAR